MNRRSIIDRVFLIALVLILMVRGSYDEVFLGAWFTGLSITCGIGILMEVIPLWREEGKRRREDNNERCEAYKREKR